MLRVCVFANWGLGCELLKILHRRQDIDIRMVVTNYNHKSQDPYINSVYDFAAAHRFFIIKQKHVDFQDMLGFVKKENIDLTIIHAFMKLLPAYLFSAPRLGSINIHSSLLPRYRGPSPTYWVLKNRESVTGLTCHVIDQGMDTGPVISQVTVAVVPGDTIGSIIEKQKEVLELLISESLARITDPDFTPTPQDESLATYFPRPQKMEETVS